MGPGSEGVAFPLFGVGGEVSAGGGIKALEAAGFGVGGIYTGRVEGPAYAGRPYCYLIL